MAPSEKRRPGRLLLLGAGLGSLVFASPASANLISPETPHSPNAEDERTLYWIALVAIVLVIVAVNGAILYAVRKYRSERGAAPRQVESGSKVQVRAMVVLSAFALVLFIAGIVYTHKARDMPPSGPDGLQAATAVLADAKVKMDPNEPLEITGTGQQWLWRYNYPNGADSYYQLVVPEDTTVDLGLVSTDVTHSWFVPALGGKFQAVPGKFNHVFFRADDLGTYRGQSATFSGSAYGAMRTEVKVVTPQEYEDFITRQKSDIQAAQDAVTSQPPPGGTQ